MTKYATEILDIINSMNCHLTAEQVFGLMKERGNDVVLATIYNNLNKLVEKRLIHRLVREGDADVYDKIIRHDHLICKKCGEIKDVFLKDYIKKFSKETGFKIEDYELQLFYTCDNCKAKM